MTSSPLDPFAGLAGSTAVVTGAARGIGLAIAEALHAVGAHVVLLDRDADEVAAAAATVGERAVAVAADVTSDHLVTAVEPVLDGLPRLAAWVNNAGVVSHQAAESVDLAEFERVARINTAGALRGSQLAFRRMTAGPDPRPDDRDGSGDVRRGGAIVNLTSLVVDKALPERLTYTASKAALQSVTRSTAAEWGRHGVRVNAVAPGYIDTRLTQWPDDDPRSAHKRATAELIPLRRIGTVADIAHAVLFLCSPLAAYVTGHVLVVDGGWHVL